MFSVFLFRSVFISLSEKEKHEQVGTIQGFGLTHTKKVPINYIMVGHC